jgi:hypothetical protein
MNGDEGYVFYASGDACGICLALDGTNTAGLPHDSCQCQIEPGSDCTHEYSGGSDHWGPGDYDATFGAEITVTCADGSEIGVSVPIDLSGFDPNSGGDILDYIEDAVDAEADALCEQCPPPPLVA